MDGALLITMNVIHGIPINTTAPTPLRRRGKLLTRATTATSHPIPRTTTSAAAIQPPQGRTARSRREGLFTVAIAADLVTGADQRSSLFHSGANCHRSPVN